MWYQHVLQSDVDDVRICWLDKKLRVGQRISLKKDNSDASWWKVNAVYDTGLEQPPRQDWHNNI